jgi:hypothetical protein
VKALSLWQPWASLIAVGAKRVETRGWRTPYRGPLAIHAALRTVRADEIEPEMADALSLSWPPTKEQLRSIPLGAIVATCRLVEVYRLSRLDADAIEDGRGLRLCPGRSYEVNVGSGSEALFGNYAEGRFAWILADVKPLARPAPVRGARGLWECRL